jgi:hypothetical protein
MKLFAEDDLSKFLRAQMGQAQETVAYAAAADLADAAKSA